MRTIYLVEDDEGIRDVLEIILQDEHYKVKSFADVKKFKSRDILIIPDLFIFDVSLPDGSGIDLCNEIKKHSANEVPVLMMSAHANYTALKSDCSPDAFISKPFEIDNFINKIRSILHWFLFLSLRDLHFRYDKMNYADLIT